MNARSRSGSSCIAALVAVIASPCAVAAAQLVPVAPFAGQVQDGFNQFGTVQALQVLEVFGGAGQIHNLSTGGAIKVEFSSTFNGDTVVPRSGMVMGQLGMADWVFGAPASQFGGWFENNSGADHATLEFFDASDALIGTAVADVPAQAQTWTWNGWQSDVPFSRIRVTGNGVINGFIWYEDMQLTFVPEPAGAVPIGLILATCTIRRRPAGHPGRDESAGSRSV